MIKIVRVHCRKVLIFHHLHSFFVRCTYNFIHYIDTFFQLYQICWNCMYTIHSEFKVLFFIHNMIRLIEIWFICNTNYFAIHAFGFLSVASHYNGFLVLSMDVSLFHDIIPYIMGDCVKVGNCYHCFFRVRNKPIYLTGWVVVRRPFEINCN